MAIVQGFVTGSNIKTLTRLKMILNILVIILSLSLSPCIQAKEMLWIYTHILQEISTVIFGSWNAI